MSHMKTIIHVNQHVIKANAKSGDRNPALTVKNYRQNQYGHEAIIRYNGVEVGRFIYSPDYPLSCGAKVWFETHANVEVLTNVYSQELSDQESLEGSGCQR